MTSSGRKLIAMLVIAGIVSGIGWIVFYRIKASQEPVERSKGSMPIPVEVAEIKDVMLRV